MKQTFSFVMALVAMMLLSTACDKNSLVEQNPSGEVKMQTVTISASIVKDPTTKTYIGDEVTEGEGAEQKTFRKVYWGEGDKIGIECSLEYTGPIVDENGIKFFEFTLQSGAGTENGVFVGQIPDGARIDIARYPYSDAYYIEEQKATPNSFDPSIASMVAMRDSEGKLVFSHNASYLKVTTDVEYSKISIKDLDIYGTPTTYSLIPATTDGTIAKGTYYIAVPPVTYDGYSDDGYTINGFTMTFEKGVKTYTKSTTNTLELKAGKVVNLGTIKLNDLRANGHAYVDLGLSSGTLWATCNVGASKPEEYGGYYAWGETTPNDSPYAWDSYKLGVNNNGN